MQRRMLMVALALVAALTVGTASAGGGPGDVHAAIKKAAARHGASRWLMTETVRCETAGTWNPASRGDWDRRAGRYRSFGSAQLNDRRTGLLWDFYARGYTDPDDPAQAMDYLARAFAGEFAGISSSRWTGARYTLAMGHGRCWEGW